MTALLPGTMDWRYPPRMLIYKILTTDQWADLQRLGETAGAPVDVADGFVHFSNAAQVQETAAKHFGGQGGLWLLSVDSSALGGTLKWELSRGGDLFPHLYAALRVADVVRTVPLSLGPTGHVFPEDL